MRFKIRVPAYEILINEKVKKQYLTGKVRVSVLKGGKEKPRTMHKSSGYPSKKAAVFETLVDTIYMCNLYTKPNRGKFVYNLALHQLIEYICKSM